MWHKDKLQNQFHQLFDLIVLYCINFHATWRSSHLQFIQSPNGCRNSFSFFSHSSFRSILPWLRCSPRKSLSFFPHSSFRSIRMLLPMMWRNFLWKEFTSSRGSWYLPDIFQLRTFPGSDTQFLEYSKGLSLACPLYRVANQSFYPAKPLNFFHAFFTACRRWRQGVH